MGILAEMAVEEEMFGDRCVYCDELERHCECDEFGSLEDDEDDYEDQTLRFIAGEGEEDDDGSTRGRNSMRQGSASSF